MRALLWVYSSPDDGSGPAYATVSLDELVTVLALLERLLIFRQVLISPGGSRAMSLDFNELQTMVTFYEASLYDEAHAEWFDAVDNGNWIVLPAGTLFPREEIADVGCVTLCVDSNQVYWRGYDRGGVHVETVCLPAELLLNLALQLLPERAVWLRDRYALLGTVDGKQ